MTIDYDNLPTEQPNPRARGLDTLSTLALVDVIHREDARALAAVGKARRAIAAAVDAVHQALAAGGRLLYVGSGTSGRLGVLDASECPPTFGAPPRQVVGVIAGGARALRRAVEGAEDAADDGARQLERLGVGQPDLVCGISASGVTPFVVGALRLARRRRCGTVLVTCGAAEQAYGRVDLVIALAVGPEVIAGSTRMKSGLATKAVLHTLTTAAMIRLGKVYDNLMVDVHPTNRKLRRRAGRIVSQLTGLDTRRAAQLLRRAGDSPKVAAVMQRRAVSAAQARELLAAANGQLRQVIG